MTTTPEVPFYSSIYELSADCMPVRLLREELGLLQQPGSYVGEVVKVMGTKKVLVKVHPEGKYGMDDGRIEAMIILLTTMQLSIFPIMLTSRNSLSASGSPCYPTLISSRRCFHRLSILSCPS
jgi:hypothetical protein